MSQQIVDAHLEGMHSQESAEPLIKLTFYALTGGAAITKADANYRRGSLRHITDVKKVRRKGRTTSIFNSEESIECTFDFIAESATGTPPARVHATTGATSSAQMPEVLSRVKVENAPAIKCGWRSDAINGDTVDPWIYEGDGSITMDDEEAWGGSITLRRYRGIPAHSVVVNS